VTISANSGGNQSANVKGIVLMLAGTSILSANLVLTRLLSQDIPPFEIVFFRGLFSLLALSPVLISIGPARLFRTSRLSLHALRAGLAICSSAAWYYAIARVPLADAMAINFVASIFVSIGAVLFLGERSVPQRWFAVAIGVVGMLIIVRPGFHVISVGILVVIGSAVFWAGSTLLLKLLLRGDASVTLLVYLYGFGALFSFPLALLNWTPLTLTHVLMLAAMGFMSTAGNFCFTHAFKVADATAVAPVDFMRLVWAAIVGYVAFSEVPSVWVFVGGGVIFASTTFLAFSERRSLAG
jgi:drug/metabolite transporter (DMT)-like permease